MKILDGKRNFKVSCDVIGNPIYEAVNNLSATLIWNNIRRDVGRRSSDVYYMIKFQSRIYIKKL